jgi:hypothetical protein
MTTKNITQLLRPLAVKWATRGALWLLTAKLGMIAAAADSEASALGNAAGAVVCMAVSLLIDRWHQKQDKAEGT